MKALTIAERIKKTAEECDKVIKSLEKIKNWNYEDTLLDEWDRVICLLESKREKIADLG